MVTYYRVGVLSASRSEFAAGKTITAATATAATAIAAGSSTQIEAYVLAKRLQLAGGDVGSEVGVRCHSSQRCKAHDRKFERLFHRDILTAAVLLGEGRVRVWEGVGLGVARAFVIAFAI